MKAFLEPILEHKKTWNLIGEVYSIFLILIILK